MEMLEEKLIEVTRTFDAPLETLWKAWVEPQRFMQWYGPKGFTVPSCEIDLQEGGKHLWCMQSPDGKKMYFTGEYLEITPMERLVFTDSPADEVGNMLGMGEGMPDFMEVTVSFMHADGKTTVTVSHLGWGPGAEYANMGWEQAFEKIAGLVE